MQPNNPFRNARWIGTDRFALPVICREFSTGLLENATLFITGLGYFEARLNGQPLTRERLLPPVSDYEPRDPTKFLYPLTDRPTNRIYYCEFDVTDLRKHPDRRRLHRPGGLYPHLFAIPALYRRHGPAREHRPGRFPSMISPSA